MSTEYEVKNIIDLAQDFGGAKPIFRFVYTNYKNETDQRIVLGFNIQFGNTEYHTEQQFFLYGLDVMKKEMRTFAMKDMQQFEEVKQ
jgi:hypothetical protein